MTPCHLAALFVLLCLTACGDSSSKGDDSESQVKDKKADQPPPLVTAVSPEVRVLESKLLLSGRVVAQVNAEIVAESSGHQILSFEKDVGDHVEAKEVVARLNATDLALAEAEAQGGVFEAKSGITEAEWALKELEAQSESQAQKIARRRQVLLRLKKEGRGVAKDDVEAAQFDLNQELSTAKTLEIQLSKAKVTEKKAGLALQRAELNLEKAKEARKRTEVRSPASGIITERLVSLGQLSSTQPLYRLYDPQSVVISCRVPQGRLRDVRLAQKARFHNDALPGLTLVGRLVLIEPLVDEQNGVVTLRIQIDSDATVAYEGNQTALASDRYSTFEKDLRAGRVLLPGMYLSGNIILERKPDTLVIPRKAVAYNRGQATLFVLEEEKAEDQGDPRMVVVRVPFREGLGDEGVVEVLPIAGNRKVALEDRIVMIGLDRLKTGDAVRLMSDQLAEDPDNPVSTETSEEGDKKSGEETEGGSK